MIDPRLIENEGPVEADENFNRVLALIDNAEKKAFGVKTEAEFLAALADVNFAIIHLLADITLTAKVDITRDNITIYGNGYSFKDATLDADQYIAFDVSGKNVTFDNVTFEISGNSDGNTIYSIYQRTDHLTLKDCTTVMANAGSSGAVSIYYEGGINHTLINNEFSNGISVVGTAELDNVVNNTFAATKGFGLGVCTVNGFVYAETSAEIVASIKASLIADGNITEDEATTLVVEGYL
jgi:hypothetical protein